MNVLICKIKNIHTKAKVETTTYTSTQATFLIHIYVIATKAYPLLAEKKILKCHKHEGWDEI